MRSTVRDNCSSIYLNKAGSKASDCGISCTCDSNNECTICKESNYCTMSP